MNLYLKFWQLRIKIYFSKSSWKTIVLDLFIILVFIYLGFILSSLFNKSAVNQNIPNNNLIKLICVALLATPLLVKIIFSDFNKKFKYSKHFPGSIKKIAILDVLVYGFLNVKNFYILFFLMSFFINSSRLFVFDYLYLILFSISGILMAENILNAITFQNVKYFSILVLALFIMIIILTRGNLSVLSLIAISVLYTVCCFFSYLFFYELPEVESKHTSSFSVNNVYLSLVLRKKIFKKSLFTALIFKFIVVFSLIIYNFNLSSLDNTDRTFLLYVFYMASLPLGFFTYMFNNIWGYYKSFALNLIISNSSLKKYLYSFLGLLMFPIFCDVIFSSFLLIIAGYFRFQFLLYYGLFCLYAFPLGFLASLLKYKKLEKGMSFTSTKANASLLANGLTVAGLVPMVFLTQNLLIGLSMFIILLIPPIVLYVLVKTDNRILQNFKNRILLMESA